MTAPNRTALIAKAHKILRKVYQPVAPVERPVLEQMLFACCLENSKYEAATKALELIRKSYFDWNEVRVTTVVELAEHMADLAHPQEQALNLRRILHGTFESTYSYDLDANKKKSLGQAVQDLKKISGATPFVLSFVTQMSLGGHSIPIDKGAMDALLIAGIVSEKEAAGGTAPGLERAIPKNKGIEFGSLLHQLGVDLLTRPFAPEVRETFLAINPEAKDRLPKRGAKKEEAAPKPAAAKPTPEKVEKKEEKPAAKPAAQTKPLGTSSEKTGAKVSEKKKEVPPSKPAVVEKPSAKGASKTPAKSSAHESAKGKAAAKPTTGKAVAKPMPR